MNNNKSKQLHRISRHTRLRKKIIGTAKRPRIAVFKSNRHVFIQFIDDVENKTVLSSKAVSKKKATLGGKKTEVAAKVAEMLGKKAKEAGITEAVFDRGGFKYHGRIKAVADGLRKGGIKI